MRIRPRPIIVLLVLVLWVPLELLVLTYGEVSWRVDESVHIDAPPERVRRWLVDPNDWPRWQAVMAPPDSWNLHCTFVSSGREVFRWGGRLGHTIELVHEAEDTLLFWIDIDDMTPLPVKLTLTPSEDGTTTRVGWSSHGFDNLADLVPWESWGLDEYTSFPSLGVMRGLAAGLPSLKRLVEAGPSPSRPGASP